MATVPTLYSSSLGDSLPATKFADALSIVRKLAAGMTLRQACAEHNTPGASFRHLIEKEPELKKLYDEAIDVGNDMLADMLLADAELPVETARARMLSDNIKWLLERRKPDRYGQRIQHTMENNATASLIAALDASIQRIPMPKSEERVQIPKPKFTDIEATFVDKKTAPVKAPSVDDEMIRLGLL